MTSETQCCDNVVTTLSDVATKIQPKPNVAATSCASWEEANNILKKYNTILKQDERNVIFHNNIKALQEIFYQGCVRFDMIVSNDRNGKNIINSSNYQTANP